MLVTQANRLHSAAQQPAGALLHDLRHQQATIAAEMDAMKVELDRALSQQPSAAAAAAAARSPSPIHRRPVSGRAASRDDPVFADPLPRGHVAADVWQSASTAAAAATVAADDCPPHPSLASASRLSCGETDGGGYYGAGGPDAAYLPSSWRPSGRDQHLSSSPGWNISTAVPPFTPHKKRQRTSADRPQPLFTQTRPKSRGFYELNSRRSATASPGLTVAPAASVRLGELKEKYGTPAAPSSAVRASGQGVSAGEGQQRGGLRPGGGGRPTNVRSRSPDMDLTIRPARYFDEAMNKGGAAVPAAGSAPCGTQAPLRGECRPVATQLGLWATMPHSTKQVAKQLGFTRER